MPNKVDPKAFELSTEDRNDPVPRLSVWAERLTTPRQAWELMGRKEWYRLVLRINVDDIRSLRPEPDSPAVPSLDVQWHPLMIGNEQEATVPDARPGADGHAGITGLMRQIGGTVNKLHTKSFRLQLADLATFSLLDPEAGDDG
jgi:hypothetical protein